MSAEPKVLLEWKEPVVTGRIMSDRTVHMAFDDGTSWKLCDDDSVSVLAIYDALSASHARVREAAEALVAKLDAVDDAVAGAFAFAALHGMAYSGPNYADELSALRAALETP